MPWKPPPLFAQGKRDNCAIACLRSILFQHGVSVTEETLEPLANKQPGGVYIADLARAAEHFGLRAEVQMCDLEAINALISDCIFPIVYLNRVLL